MPIAPRFTPQPVVEPHDLDVLRELGMLGQILDELFAMVVSDWDDGKEVRARDTIPASTNPHATPEGGDCVGTQCGTIRDVGVVRAQRPEQTRPQSLEVLLSNTP